MATLTSAPTATFRRSSVQPLFDYLLLLIMLMNLAWSMRSAQWVPGLDRLLPVAFIATSASTLAALGGFGRGFSTLYSLVVGLAALLSNVAALAPAEFTMQERAYYLVDRTFTWLAGVATGQPIADNLVFVLVLALVVWLLSYSAVWTYFRERRKWQAVLPVGVAMLINLYYAPPRLNIYFLVYVFCVILLLVRATLSERTRQWHADRVYYPFDIAVDFTRDTLLFASIVIMLAWVLPTSASGGKLASVLDPLEQPWRQAQEEWNRLFSTLNYGRATGGTPTFGTSLGLGGPREVTDSLVMDVKTPIDRYYRATVVDTYIAGGWTLAPTTGVHLDQVAVTPPAWEGRRAITQTMILYQDVSVLVAAPQPLSASLPVDARLIRSLSAPATLPGAGSAPEEVELAMLVSPRMINRGESYQVVSAIADVTAPELRSAGVDYPASIRARYLQLPESIPARVFALADELKGSLDNPFDIAKAVEAYLRGFPYNDQIAGPRPGQDGIDYFLFEEKQGYCNYYASALAVMLRHLGIPTRVAIGYATGEFQRETSVYRIRNLDLHAWVEVYFPRYGWIEFEPTASEPMLNRSEGGITLEEDEFDRIGDRPDENLAGNAPDLPEVDALVDLSPAQRLLAWVQSHPGWIGLLAAVSILLAVLASGRRMQRSQPRRRPVIRIVPDGFAARLWEKLMVWAQRLGASQHSSLTPLEKAEALAQSAPAATSGIHTIADLYTRDLYSPHAITAADASDAQMAWFEVRPLLRQRWFDQRLRLPARLKQMLRRRGE